MPCLPLKATTVVERPPPHQIDGVVRVDWNDAFDHPQQIASVIVEPLVADVKGSPEKKLLVGLPRPENLYIGGDRVVVRDVPL